MNKIFKLALQNLSRQKKRNMILAIAISFGFFVVTSIEGFTNGIVQNLETVFSQFAGGTVLIAGYEKPKAEEGTKQKVVNIVREHDYIKNLVLENDIDYKYFSRQTESSGQMIFNGKKSMAMVSGRDFSEKEFLDSLQIVSGKIEDITDPQAMIISSKFAENLNLEVGDEVVYSCTTVYGQNNAGDFKVALITKANSLVDSTQVFVNIESLNTLLEIPEGGYSTFTIFLKNKNQQAQVADKIENLIREDGKNVSDRHLAMKISPKNVAAGIERQFTRSEYQWEGTKYGVECLDDVIPAMKTVLSIVNMVTTAILLVILLIVMVGVSNTYRMVLYERIREIGTMRALGMSGKDTGRLFTTEAVILCLLGAVAGFLLSVIFMTIIHFIPVQSETLALFLDKGHFTFALSASSVILKYVLLIILTSLAVRGSAKKAAAMSPAEALRTVK